MGAIVGAKEWASLVGVIVGAIVGAKEWASLVGVLSGRIKNCVGEKKRAARSAARFKKKREKMLCRYYSLGGEIFL